MFVVDTLNGPHKIMVDFYKLCSNKCNCIELDINTRTLKLYKNELRVDFMYPTWYAFDRNTKALIYGYNEFGPINKLVTLPDPDSIINNTVVWLQSLLDSGEVDIETNEATGDE